MRLDGLIAVTLMLLPLVTMEGTAYIFWIVVTGAYILYIAHKTREWVVSNE